MTACSSSLNGVSSGKSSTSWSGPERRTSLRRPQSMVDQALVDRFQFIHALLQSVAIRHERLCGIHQRFVITTLRLQLL